MWKSVSEHFGKVWADQIAAVMYPGIPLRAIAVEHFAPDHQVALAAVLLDQLSHAVAALAVALGALDAQHVELALNIAEDDVTAGQLKLPQLDLELRLVRVPQHGDDGGVGNEFVQQRQLFGRQIGLGEDHARNVAARPAEAGDQASSDRIPTGGNTIGIVAVAALAAGTARPLAAIATTWRRTRSAAISGSRSS